jgi:hypothetical protein
VLVDEKTRGRTSRQIFPLNIHTTLISSVYFGAPNIKILLSLKERAFVVNHSSRLLSKIKRIYTNISKGLNLQYE